MLNSCLKLYKELFECRGRGVYCFVLLLCAALTLLIWQQNQFLRFVKSNMSDITNITDVQNRQMKESIHRSSYNSTETTNQIDGKSLIVNVINGKLKEPPKDKFTPSMSNTSVYLILESSQEYGRVKSEIKSRKQFYICTRTVDRLGNQMFQFASGLGIAAKKGMKMVIGRNDVINQVFELTNHNHLIISDKHECTNAIKRTEKQLCAYDPSLVDFEPDASYFLQNYLQSWKYFNESATLIRSQLIFRSEIRLKVTHIIDSVIKKYKYRWRGNVTLIAVHIRRGDILSDSNRELGYLAADRGYLVRAVNHFGNISNKVFLICSDDIKWSEQNMPRNGIAVEFMTGNSAEVDMALLASCDHIISTVGTFSWWAAWLNNGIVTYYKWPARNGTIKRSLYSATYMDHYYPSWVGL